jgi:hypothetical protein
MKPYDNGFTNTLWTQIIVMGPYDKGFTNTFWTETIVMGPYDKGGFKFITLVVIGTDCIFSCKSNYHTIMTTIKCLLYLFSSFYDFPFGVNLSFVF